MFYQIDYGNIKSYRAVGFEYLIWFLGLYSVVALPLCILYNLIINSEAVQNANGVRFILALALGLIVGFLMGRGGVSYYIGEYKAVKHLVLFPLVLISTEFVRGFVVKMRYSKHTTENV
jgi:hypothetical protein